MEQRPAIASVLGLREVLCLIALSCPLSSSVYAQQALSLVGQVRSQDGPALSSGVTVRLETPERMPITNVTPDGEGRFEISDVPIPKCHLIVTAEGFQTYMQDLDWGYSHVLTVSIYLVPINKSKGSPQAVATLSDDNAPKKARKAYLKGIEAVNEGRRDEARSHLGKALGEFPCYARAQVALAQIDMEDQKLENAEAALKKAIQCDSGLPLGYQELGRLYVFEQRFSEGEKILQEGVRLAPSSWELHYILGAADFGLGKYKEAEQAYLKAASFNPAMPVNFRLRLANLYLKTHENDKAYVQLQAYLREAPEGPAAESVKKMVKRLGSTSRVDPSADGSIDILDSTR